jgi:UDP-2,3-diacylglucosamine pyrophosphatase LpxH
MLVIISDLHWRDDPEWTTPLAMTDGFLRKSLVPMVRDAMRRVRQPNAREVEVLFLGDWLDINRCRYWVNGQSGRYRPWSNWRPLSKAPDASGAQSPADAFDEQVRNAIVAILKANAKSQAAWLSFKDLASEYWSGDVEGNPEVIRFHYVPGNHDRLANLSPSIRALLIRELRLEGNPDAPFPWAQVYPEYGVAALHGHVLDPPNFGGKETPDDLSSAPDYDLPAFGDALTVHFGVALHERAEADPRLKPLARSLGMIDLVRPQRAAFEWLRRWGLTYKVDSELSALMNALGDEFLSEPFVKSQVRKLAPLWAQALLKVGVAPRTMRQWLWLFRALSGGGTAEEEDRKMRDAFVDGPAAQWVARQGQALNVVSGHTHRPLVAGLAGDVGENPQTERTYLNTGCWLDVVERGPVGSGFVCRHQVMHAVFYRDFEDRGSGGQRRYWEYWQGNLREERP